MGWVRNGECNRCGECCKSGDPFNGRMGIGEFGLSVCPLLKLIDNLHTCSDRQNNYYLNGCAHWPSRPEHIVNYPSCSYTFEWVD